MKRKNILAIILVLIAGCFVFFGLKEILGSGTSKKTTGTDSSKLNQIDAETEAHEISSYEEVSNEKSTNEDKISCVTENASEEPSSDSERKLTDSGQDKNLGSIPVYSGKPYYELDGNIPLFTEAEKKKIDAFEYYSDLDPLGRCGAAFANICPELMPTEERGAIGHVRPSGWHTVKYNDLIDGNYLYNRCHLIAYSLAGENDNVKNLITGTRYLNVEGMLPFEERVLNYVQRTGNHVLYRVTPIFIGDELVAEGVLMEGWSVEDSGDGICFHVYCYNVQPGIEIDYLTGDSKKDDGKEFSAEINTEYVDSVGNGIVESTGESGIASYDPVIIGIGDETDSEQIDRNQPVEAEEKEYILNTNTKKIHLPNCSSVGDMKEKNKKAVREKIEDLKKQGYVPCKRCLSGY